MMAAGPHAWRLRRRALGACPLATIRRGLRSSGYWTRSLRRGLAEDRGCDQLLVEDQQVGRGEVVVLDSLLCPQRYAHGAGAAERRRAAPPWAPPSAARCCGRSDGLPCPRPTRSHSDADKRSQTGAETRLSQIRATPAFCAIARKCATTPPSRVSPPTLRRIDRAS